MIRVRNPFAKIFVAALLPLPGSKTDVKQNIIKFNRVLAEVINSMHKKDARIIFLPVQHRFTKDGSVCTQYYNRELTALNPEGATMLRRAMFDLAGFTLNSV